MSKFGDCMNDKAAVARVMHVGDECLVDLHLREGQTPQLHQRGVTGPEIVDRKADSLDAEPSQRVHQLDQRLRRALGELEHEAIGRNLKRGAHALDEVRKIEVLQAERRNVEGDRRVDPLVAPVEPLPENRPKAPLSEVVDEPVFLGERHEPRRLDAAQFRILPADQRLDPLQCAVAKLDLGLVEHVQLLLLRARATRRASSFSSALLGTVRALP